MRTRSSSGRSARGTSKAVYSVAELADMAGMEKRAMTRLLSSNGVPFGRTGNKRIVFLSDLHASMPELVDSVRYGGGDE